MVKRYDVGWDEQPYEDPDGPYVLCGDYKKLEEEHRALVKRYAALTPVSPHDFFNRVDQND